MSELSDSVEESWRTVHEAVIGANCVCARPSHNNNHLNLYVHKADSISKIEIPNTKLYQESNIPQENIAYV
ncbi:MAG: hypothetical protein PHH54_03040 [Candidatus Nanoarchaeia archaeon]|nr:hypothetical protein [Candidatus Nanoarchaeia archaeon]MDD5740936.1 hypothetical protein [Candidatus Nanoarchaeia archaeon]